MTMTKSFCDIRNSWEMREEPKIDGNWADVQCELIKLAAKCQNYSSDIVIDINGMNKKIHNGDEFIAHLYFYECGVHSTLEYSGNESEEWKCEEIQKHCDGIFASVKIQYKKVSERDYELTFETL